MRALTLGAMIAGLTAGAAWAGPRSYAVPDPTAQLRPPQESGLSTGYEAAQANCQTCHSVDYIATQPPGRGKAFWEAEVAKMIKAYHAPIEQADAGAIAAYLAGTY
jgi:mono/diheme cytochrome c family protein